MTLDFLPPSLHQQIQQSLRNFNFKYLFIEKLNWNNPSNNIPIIEPIAQQKYVIKPLAEKASFVVYKCELDTHDIALHEHKRRAEIDRRVTREKHEHIIIFTDTAKTQQIWLWVRREPGQPIARREEHFHKSQSGERLAQILNGLTIDLKEEEGLTVSTITGRVSRAFDTEPLTKKFYRLFKLEQKKFFESIDGIPSETERHWYTTLMLSRLILVYFIQKKKLLDNDDDYLMSRMKDIEQKRSQENFLTFYRDFLLRLFHEGFANQTRTPELEDLLKRVPYLNGSLFDKRELEERNLGIEIPDSSFKSVLTFLNGFKWHLDTRRQHNDKEINPDVLGYIFEQLVNGQESKRDTNKGAYYTKEDITEYIAKSTVIPYLLNAVKQKYPEAFEPSGPIWRLLKSDPDRYIYDAVKKGCAIPLLLDIEVGTKDVTQRKRWNEPAPDGINEYALPTETWREVVERRKHYEHIYTVLATGEICSIDDLITYNLDICQFVQDVLDNCEDIRLLHTLYYTIAGRNATSHNAEELGISVLDPTCGSGAFLLAALNILQPIYQACLRRIESILEENSTQEGELFTSYMLDFRKILAQTEEYPNRDFFIIKSIIIHNIYGVDIMKEANEICKLRLFLKLMAYVDSYDQTKPLPNVDFNIYTGNSLIGFVNMEDTRVPVLKDMGSKLISEKTLQRIEAKMNEVEQGIEDFRIIQMDPIPARDDILLWKKHIQRRLSYLRCKLNRYLAAEYGIDRNNISDKKEYLRRLKVWEEQQQPFHWLIEYYKIMKNGGFSVIIGNPPYVELPKVKDVYQRKNFATISCGNQYALVMERCIKLTCMNGRNGMIVQLPIMCTDRMLPLQNLLKDNSSVLWLSTYDDRPAKLFDGLEHIRASIIINDISQAKPVIWATKYNRWYTYVREGLFPSLNFSDITTWNYSGTFPKVGTTTEESIYKKLQAHAPLGTNLTGKNKIYFHNAPQYWIRAITFKPYFWNEKEGEKVSTQVKPLVLPNKIDADVTAVVLNSSLFYWWFVLLSDCRHLNMREIEHFPLGLACMNNVYKKTLSTISEMLMEDYQKHSVRKEARYKTTGKVVYDEFYPKRSKSIIDEIDRVLAQHYGFTDEELDFIINYDIKYRMGKHHNEEEEE